MNYKHICCLDSVYSLFIYLLLYPQVKSETFFFISDGVAKIIRKKLPYYKYIPVPKTTNKVAVFLYHICIYIYLYFYTKIKRFRRDCRRLGMIF